MRRQISQPPQDATEDKGLNVGTSAQKAIKTGMQSPFQKKHTARGEVTSGPSPYLCQAVAENDNRI